MESRRTIRLGVFFKLDLGCEQSDEGECNGDRREDTEAKLSKL